MDKIKIEMCLSLKEGESVEQFRPRKAHPGDAAFDLFNAEECFAILLNPRARAVFSAGFKMELPPGYEAQIRPCSGNASKKGLTVLNSPGTIDANYRGIVGMILYNSDKTSPITIHRGDKIAQMVIQKLPEVELEFVEKVDEESDRGADGFGSTGTV